MARRRRRESGKRKARRLNSPRRKRTDGGAGPIAPPAPKAARSPTKPAPARTRQRRSHPPGPTPVALHPEPTTSGRAGFWQVYACGALCAFSAATGLLRVIGEMQVQLVGARAGVASVGSALALGVVLGLLVPRRVIRRRLGSLSAGPVGRPAGAVAADHEFVASLTGLLILALAAIWCLLSGLMAGMEGYRALLTQRFLHPPWLTLLLLGAPAFGGLVLLGAVGAMVLVALHGWQRMAGRANHGVRLWLVLLAGVLVGALFSRTYGRPAALTVATLLATLVAGILAVLRKPPELPRAAALPARAFSPGIFWAELTSAAVASASLGAAIMAATPPDCALDDCFSTGLLVATAGIALAVLLVQMLRLPGVASPGLSAFALLALALVWVLPQRVGTLADLARAAPRLGLSSGLAAVCVLSAAASMVRTLKRTPPVVARAGVATSVGLAAGLLISAACLNESRASIVAVVITLTLAAIASLMLIYHRRTGLWPRVVGLALVAVLLALALTSAMPPGTSIHPSSSPYTSAVRNAAVDAGRQVLRSPGLRTLFATTAGDDQPSALAIDLAGPRWDVIVLTTNQTPAVSAKPKLMRRCLKRARSALLTGGRLVVELREEGLSREILDSDAICHDQSQTDCRLLVVSGDQERYTALVIGRDVAAWLMQQPVAPGFEAQLRHPFRPDGHYGLSP